MRTREFRYNHCRYCKKSEYGDGVDRLVKYGPRHYAHHACYLDAGRKLEDLPAWKVGEFPFRLLKDRGLLDLAENIIARDRQQRVDRLAEHEAQS